MINDQYRVLIGFYYCKSRLRHLWLGDDAEKYHRGGKYKHTPVSHILKTHPADEKGRNFVMGHDASTALSLR
jgi:hypothetical protein